jgi:hypothetical protein
MQAKSVTTTAAAIASPLETSLAPPGLLLLKPPPDPETVVFAVAIGTRTVFGPETSKPNR